MEKILFDTDIGCDIDDALCLCYLLEKKECELLGITTVCGDTVSRAQLAKYLCDAAGQEIPICAGVQKATILDRKLKGNPQIEYIPPEKRAPAEQFTRYNVVEFMRSIILAHPHEVTLLAVGPFTNVGLLFAAAPEVIPLLKGLTIMGGNYFNPFTGYGLFSSNAMYDPHATYIMYHAHVASHRALGSDVTNNITMPVCEKEIFPLHPTLKAAMPLVDYYFGGWRQPILYHDAVAATTIFNESIAHFERGHVDVELQGNAMQGVTLFKRNAYLDNYNEVAHTVDRDAFVREYLSAFGITPEQLTAPAAKKQ